MFTLAHLSDPHLGPLPRATPRQLASKRLLGYLNWQRRAKFFRPEILVELLAAVGTMAPDHTAVTGDLVNLGLPGEIEFARAWLEGLGSPDRVSLVPGNHDAYVRGALAAAAKLWHPFLVGDDGKAGFPYVRRRGPIALIGLSTALATPHFMATGALGGEQIAALRQLLWGLGKEGLFRIVLIHHPVAKDATAFHRRLTDAAAFRAAIAESGAELILHGHNHTSSVSTIAGRDGKIPVVGVPSASNAPGGAHHPGAAFNLYRIDGKRGAFTLNMREFGFTEPGQPIRLICERRLS